MVRVVFALTVLGGVGLLTLAVWPGMVEVVVCGFPFGCGCLVALAAWSLLLFGLALADLFDRPDPPARRRWWGVRSAAVMFATLGLLVLHVPQRVAFAFCAADLRPLADAAPDGDIGGVGLGRSVGPYQVDRYGADGRGGVFFRTATGPDGIGPDQMSYGFAFRPNGQGSPFGGSSYRLSHLFGEWYAFSVSND
jgi:hypothetical protein